MNTQNGPALRSAALQRMSQMMPASVEHVLSLFVLDASGSMTPFRDSLQRETQKHLDTLRAHPNSHQYSLGIIGFNTHAWIEQRIARVKDLTSVAPITTGSETRLYATAAQVLAELRETVAEMRRGSIETMVVMMVLTDGVDNRSTPEDLRRLREHAAAAVREHIVPILIGFGVDAKPIAREMGFPEEFAFSVERSDQGLTTAVSATTHITMTMTGDEWRARTKR